MIATKKELALVVLAAADAIEDGDPERLRVIAKRLLREHRLQSSFISGTWTDRGRLVEHQGGTWAPDAGSWAE